MEEEKKKKKRICCYNLQKDNIFWKNKCGLNFKTYEKLTIFI